MYKTTGFGKRILGTFMNGLIQGATVLFGLGAIVQLVLVLTKGKTLGAIVAGYKYADRNTGLAPDKGRFVIYFFVRALAGLLYFVTLTIAYWVMLAKRKKNIGTFAEKWSGIIKVDKNVKLMSIAKQAEVKAAEAAKAEEMANKFVDTRTGEPALEIINFTKHYKGRPNPAVADASFKVYPGEFHGFIGANGAGKTTAIKSIIGAYAKYEGQVKIFGELNKTVHAKKSLGYIPEAANFPKKFTTLEYIVHMSRLSGLSKKEAKKRALKSLEEGNLMAIAKASPNSLSSGQKKKVLLAQALVHDPKIVVMDEPAANLDPKARIEFFDTLRQLQKDKKSILISSHILAELDKYIDSVTILDGGKVVYSGLVKELTKNPLMTFRVQTSDNAKVKEYLTKKKITFKMSKDKEKVILADMINSKNIMDLQKFIITKNLLIEEFKNNVITVEQVYENFVKYGSVDTGAGRKAPVAKTPEVKISAKEVEVKKTPTKKVEAKKAPVAKKVEAKKAPAKKTATKKGGK